MRAALRFLREHRGLLAFGFVMNGASAFGQTYFVALFSGAIRGDFGLSHGAFGAIYSGATLASSATILWLGGAIDRVDLRRYAGAVCLGLALAALLLAATPAAIVLAVALYAIRLTGQGLMTHTAMSTMARYFERERGRALSLAALGRPAGEMVLPVLAVLALDRLGWRVTWVLVAAIAAFVLSPLVVLLLRGHRERHARLQRDLASRQGGDRVRANGPDEGPEPGGDAARQRGSDDGRAPAGPARSRSRREVIRDPGFWRRMPCALATPFLLTGVFFHQIHLCEAKGWSVEWFAGGFVAYAAATVVASLLGGPFVDRFGAGRLLRAVLAPLALGLGLLAAFDAPWIAWAFLTAAGAAMGLAGIVLGALWAELYGVANVGAIRSLTSSLMVASTALAPVTSGALIDRGVSPETLSLLGVAFVAFAFVLVPGADPRRETPSEARKNSGREGL